MNEFMKILLSLSVSGTLLLLFILGLKPLYKNKFSRRWQYYIWIIVVLRFLVPFTPGTTIVGSLFEKYSATVLANESYSNPNMTDKINMNGSGTKRTNVYEQAQAGASDKSQMQPRVNAANRIQAQSQSKPYTQTEPQTSYNAIDAAAAFSFPNLYMCLFFAWAAFALVLFVRKITIYQGFIRYIQAGNTEISDIKALNLLSECMEKLNIKTRVELYRNASITSPIMIGFFHPSIVLPAGELGNKELSYVFVHELLHYQKKDMFYKWLVQIVICIHWFNPFVYLLEKEINKACELSCDEAVIFMLDESARREYGDTLISFMKSNDLNKNSLASVTLTEGAEQLKERLGAIMSFKKKTKLITVSTTVFTIAVCFCFLAVGAYAAPSANSNRAVWENNEIFNGVLTEDGVYYIFCDGAGENDKPLSSVTDGCVKFVLVWKDRYTSIGPFSNLSTLTKDVNEQCDFMIKSGTITEEEKKLVLDIAKNIAFGWDDEDADDDWDNDTTEMKTLELKGKTYYLVFNEDQLRAIGTGEYGMDKNYMQQADIQLSTNEWIPIGTWDNPFTGTFNGNGFEIIGLTMTDPDAKIIGLFGVSKNADIYNVTMRDYDIMDAGRNASGKTVGAILAVGYGVRSYDNFAYPKGNSEDGTSDWYRKVNDFDFDWNDKDVNDDWNFDWDDEFAEDKWDFDWDDEFADDKWDWDWEDKAFLEEYAAYGIEKVDNLFYYQGELVYILKDQRPDSSCYLLDTNSKGTVSIKVVHNEEGKITGISYMTDEEVQELMPKLLGSSE